MTWVKLDEEFPDHPKVAAAGPLASWLHVCALAYCNRFLTDGFVPRAQVSKLATFDNIFVGTWGSDLAGGLDEVKPLHLADDLVGAEMWEAVEGGWLIHDYLTYQPSRAKVLEEREKKARAGSAGGKKTAENRAGAPASAPAPATAERPADAQAKSKPVPVPVTDTSSSSPSYSTGAAQPVDDEERLRNEAVERLAAREEQVGAVYDQEAWIAEDMLRNRTRLLVEEQRRREAEAERRLIEDCELCNDKGLRELEDGWSRCEHGLAESA